jgi:RNA polymerase sigma-70 factor (ECF subfamily)
MAGERLPLRLAERSMRVEPTLPQLTSAEVAREFRARLVRFIRGRVDNAADAEDIAQDVLLRVHRSIGTLANSERLAPWLFQVAHNAIVDHYRTRGRAAEVVDPHTPADDVADRHLSRCDDDPGRLQRDATRCLDAFIERLDEPHAAALRLVDVEGLTNKDAAARLGLSIPGVKSRVQRARASLRKTLGECCALDFSAADGSVEYDACPPAAGGCAAEGCGCRMNVRPGAPKCAA